MQFFGVFGFNFFRFRFERFLVHDVEVMAEMSKMKDVLTGYGSFTFIVTQKASRICIRS